MSESRSGPRLEPPAARPGQVVEWGPERVRNEVRWGLVLADGSRAVLAQLLPELAGDPSLRRRYVYEVERLAGLGSPHLAKILALGPQPDPRDPRAGPPWRLRAAPPGRSLDAWLTARAPVPLDEALARVADLADAVHGIHTAGAVLRDLEPRCVILGDPQTDAARGGDDGGGDSGRDPRRGDDDDGGDSGRDSERDGPALWLVDVGLARLDILSSRTASSLMLESSPYAAPEHLRATVIDLRADVFTLGVILWRALTGTLPFGAGGGVLRRYDQLPRLADLCPGAPEALDRLVRRCLAEDPDQRPDSARDLADVLRGRDSLTELSLAEVPCQACGARMRPGLRLCLACGKTAVQFHHAGPDAAERCTLLLVQARDDAAFLRKLRQFFADIAEQPPARLDFLIGDARMYSRAERQALQKLPAPLFTDLSPETAELLAARLRADGFTVKLTSSRTRARRARRGARILAGGVTTALVAPFVVAAGATGLGIGMFALGAAAAVTGGILRGTASTQRAASVVPMARLRAAPAALPASDPYVARMAALLAGSPAPDVAERIAELALGLQRLSDHRAALSDPDEIERLLAEPLDRATELIAAQVGAIGRIDEELAGLDEGTLIRAIAASEARRDPPARRHELLAGLDRLRGLEDRRAAHMQRLLEASSLLARTTHLGLESGADDRVEQNHVTLALAALGADPDGPRGP